MHRTGSKWLQNHYRTVTFKFSTAFFDFLWITLDFSVDKLLITCVKASFLNCYKTIKKSYITIIVDNPVDKLLISCWQVIFRSRFNFRQYSDLWIMWITSLVIHKVIHRQNGLVSGLSWVFHIIHSPYYYYYKRIWHLHRTRARARQKMN